MCSQEGKRRDRRLTSSSSSSSSSFSSENSCPLRISSSSLSSSSNSSSSSSSSSSSETGAKKSAALGPWQWHQGTKISGLGIRYSPNHLEVFTQTIMKVSACKLNTRLTLDLEEGETATEDWRSELASRAPSETNLSRISHTQVFKYPSRAHLQLPSPQGHTLWRLLIILLVVIHLVLTHDHALIIIRHEDRQRLVARYEDL